MYWVGEWENVSSRRKMSSGRARGNFWRGRGQRFRGQRRVNSQAGRGIWAKTLFSFDLNDAQSTSLWTNNTIFSSRLIQFNVSFWACLTLILWLQQLFIISQVKEGILQIHNILVRRLNINLDSPIPFISHLVNVTNFPIRVLKMYHNKPALWRGSNK